METSTLYIVLSPDIWLSERKRIQWVFFWQASSFCSSQGLCGQSITLLPHSATPLSENCPPWPPQFHSQDHACCVLPPHPTCSDDACSLIKSRALTDWEDEGIKRLWAIHLRLTWLLFLSIIHFCNFFQTTKLWFYFLNEAATAVNFNITILP